MESAITFPLRVNFAVPPVRTGSGFNATEISSMSFPPLSSMSSSFSSASQVSHSNAFPNIPSRDDAVESRTEEEDEDEEEEAEKTKAECTSKRRSTRFDFANELVIVLGVFIASRYFIWGNVNAFTTQKLRFQLARITCLSSSSSRKEEEEKVVLMSVVAFEVFFERAPHQHLMR
jgi:hypothetical protein